SYSDGTVEVLAVTEAQVTLRLAGTAKVLGTLANADGDYDVLRCDATPRLLASAVAKANVMEPGDLMIYATNQPNTCADPEPSSAGCSIETAIVAIDLPPAMQAVGTYPLSGIATFTVAGSVPPGGCVMGMGTYGSGTIEIVSIDASQVIFTLSGTGSLI